MRSKTFAVMIVAVIVIFAEYNIYSSQKTSALSDLALVNIEALANGEDGGNSLMCYSSSEFKSGAVYRDCSNCSVEYNATGIGPSSTCN